VFRYGGVFFLQEHSVVRMKWLFDSRYMAAHCGIFTWTGGHGLVRRGHSIADHMREMLVLAQPLYDSGMIYVRCDRWNPTSKQG
jgi:hypothetical protein